MADKIVITKKEFKSGDDNHKVISVRMHVDLIEKLEKIAFSTNRSRNEVINSLLAQAIDMLDISD